VTSDTYAVGAVNDHIVPWHGSYKTWGLLGGEVGYVLSSGGQIAGIVNPPGLKAWYEAGGYARASPDTWRAAASKHKGSWWEDWTAWSDARTGARQAAALGQQTAPVLGEYVRG
jgi:polyhydroxyalkanoate synthase